MALGKKGLGRGFDSLFPTDLVDEAFDPTSDEDAKVSKLVELKVADVIRDEEQPRKDFDQEALQDLANSISEHGLLQPIVVAKKGDKYQIIAGERRWRASQLAGKETIPAIVRTIDAQNKLELMIVENLQREDLNPIELATAYAKLKEQFNLTNEDIAKRIGKSTTTVVNTMRLLKLPDEAKVAMREHNLGEGPMRPLISLTPEEIHEVLPKMIDGGWSSRKVEQYVAENKKKSSLQATKSTIYLKEEAKLSRAYDCEVKIRGRSITFSTKDDENFKRLLNIFSQKSE